jgi:DNA-binding MarR family transcriptional regulator
MMTSGGMTAAIDRLERKGLVERAPNPHDRRGSLVRLTADGLAIIDEAMTRHAGIEQHLTVGLDQRERAQLRRLLHKLIDAIERR